jgi:hypothetical protein
MPLELEHVRRAARLIAFGLTPAKRPTNDPDYERLVRAYLDDPTLASAARELAAGLGLRLLDVSDYGVTLGAQPESPFGLTVQEYQAGLSAEERLLHGLVQVGLAAYLYPRAEDLEADAEVVEVRVEELERFLRETCEAAARSLPPAGDTPAAYPDLEDAFRIYLRWPSTHATKDGRRAAKTTEGIIAQALERLCEHGLMQRARSEGGEVFKALRRYRVQVRELASHEALQIIRQAREPIEGHAGAR